MSAAATWPALVLAAGLGSRLAPLSALRAKPALPVAGTALIIRILKRLRAAGITRVVINLHHLADTITAVVGDGRALDLDVRYSWETTPLGSGGGPARALPLLAADRFFIVNGDTLSDVDLAELSRAHVASGAAATMTVAPADLDKYNALLADADGRLLGSVMRGTPLDTLPPGARPWHYVGVQAVDAAAFAGVARDRDSDVIRGVYADLVRRTPGAIRVYPSDAAFHDIGTPGDYLTTALRFTADGDGPADIGRDCRLSPTATLRDTILWDRVTIADNAVLERCIVTDDVVIGAGARYRDVVITTGGITSL
ncbi:MAG: NDP-sugar synthase [Acidobacteria bacterium]|nr:NDP-sugar synthase [Acidobacteriota bacterium]